MTKLIKIGALISVILFSLNVKGQKEYRFLKNSTLGVKVGGNYSSISLQPKVSALGGDFSYSVGLSYIFSNKKNVGIQLDLLYNSRKWIEIYDDSLNVTTDLSYIQFPLITNISIGNGRIKYLINLGTYFAYNMDKKVRSDLPADHQYYESIMDRREKKGDFGLIIGAGLRYFTGIGTFQLDGRFEYGYQNLYDEDESGFRYSNMSVIQVGLYYYFINLNKGK